MGATNTRQRGEQQQQQQQNTPQPAAAPHSPEGMPEAAANELKLAGSARHGTRPGLLSWSASGVVLFTMVFLSSVIYSFVNRQRDTKGCRMSYMYPSYAKLSAFDTEHTQFAGKYSLYLYREQGVDTLLEPNGVPVLFIPGNAGSYKQVRPIAAEASRSFADALAANGSILETGSRNLDFFTVDFNEDITAFHGQTLLDQAEYLNEAVAFILSLYHDTRKSKYDRDLPDPSSVIILGHSMGGIVARTMLTIPNYQSNSINTIITMSTPHALPPVPFDWQIVQTYNTINTYWRKSYTAQWANNNPLWQVTLVSIAGGGLDTVVPSDYSSISSLVPSTHGFTVFTSSVPNVWTGMDHQAILWCDQFRKVVAGSLLEIVDVHRPGQTVPRADRMRLFRKWYLSGLEDVVDKHFSKEPRETLTLEPEEHRVLRPQERLTLRALGGSRERAFLLPVPSSASATAFSLLTNGRIGRPGQEADLAVYLCNQVSTTPATPVIGGASVSTRLTCKAANQDVITLPASTRETKNPFEGQIFSHIRYAFKDIAQYQTIAVLDLEPREAPIFAVAEFENSTAASMTYNAGLVSILYSGLDVTLDSRRPLLSEIAIPAIRSSLLTYKLSFHQKDCDSDSGLFKPLIRQSISDPYESKYFVNTDEANINLHGLAPYVLYAKDGGHTGLSLQIWSDPTCDNPVRISLRVDFFGSLGKLVMRFRTVFAAFPLIAVALTLRKQFSVYDKTGTFISHGHALDSIIASSFLANIIWPSALSLVCACMHSQDSAKIRNLFQFASQSPAGMLVASSQKKLDVFLGLQEPFFWFLGPVFFMLSIGICVIVYYLVVLLTHVLAGVYVYLDREPGWQNNDSARRSQGSQFVANSPRRRLLTTLALLFFVATLVPYQFAYVVACMVQLATCVKALKCARESPAAVEASLNLWNFYNYSLSILILMIWILPINIPVLIVWIHNLAIHLVTPFSSHHNVLFVMPFVLIVETLTTGNMIPRSSLRGRLLTNVMFLILACYAALYGVVYTYLLHHLVNICVAWLVILHFSSVQGKFSLNNFSDMLQDKPRKQT